MPQLLFSSQYKSRIKSFLKHHKQNFDVHGCRALQTCKTNDLYVQDCSTWGKKDIFGNRTDYKDIEVPWGKRVKIGWHMLEHLKWTGLLGLSGGNFQSRGLILKTISWQTSGPLPWTIWDLKYWFWQESLKKKGLTCVCLQKELNLSLKECSRLFLWCGSEPRHAVYCKCIINCQVVLVVFTHPTFPFLTLVHFWSPSLCFSLKLLAHLDGYQTDCPVNATHFLKSS